MRIAITSDLHLTTLDRHPERFHAFENILEKLLKMKIDHLIIAGDLFDDTCTSPGDFEGIFSKKDFSRINIFVIPGNHDPFLSQGTFSLPNLKQISEPQIIHFSGSIPFVFIPYRDNMYMGELLADQFFDLEPDNWVLVSHGDWISNRIQKNAYEKGTYMPLSARDIDLFKPKKVFLGHIHAKSDHPIVHFPGSPCAIDITETGYRSFLLFDTDTWNTSRIQVDTDYIFFNEIITVVPIQNEDLYVQEKLDTMIESWKTKPEDKTKIRLSIKAIGYSSNRERLIENIKERLDGYQFAGKGQPDISLVKISTEIKLAELTESVGKLIDSLELTDGDGEPTKDDITLSTMNIIFGGK
jgi:DNA repair exonuclease SbcCD nuclease subunit